MMWLWTCCSDDLCHLAECQAKLNVAFKLSGMKSVLLSIGRCIKLEKSELDGSLCEGCVVVEHMVSAVIVVLAASVVTTLCAVPDVCKLAHGLWFLLVELL